MAETSTIADMARYAAREIFSVFGWRQVGLLDQNWDCTTDEHGKRTHPSDVVFCYDDPYTPYRTFINTDLKSYGGSTIDRGALGGALRSMAIAIECANSGPDWRALYDDGTTNSTVLGMLFVYNHDENFKDDNGEFQAKINGLSRESLAGSMGHTIVAFGPSDITYLFTVATDIKALRGEGRIPMEQAGTCSYWYADLVQTKIREQEFSAATIEMLSGPWIIMRTDIHRYTLWYRGHGSCEEEFRYLLEYIFFYQLLNHELAAIDIRLVHSHPHAVDYFSKATDKFDRAHHRLATERLKRIHCESVSVIRSSFSTKKLGWER